VSQEPRSRRIKRIRAAVIVSAVIVALLLVVSLYIVWPSISLPRRPFSVPDASYHTWDEILSHPQPVTVRTYSTGINRTTRAGIMNLAHEKAQGIEDKEIDIPVNVGIVQHQKNGAYLIDAGLDRSYVHNPYGTNKGLMVKSYLAKGRQEPGADIASIVEQESIPLQGVFLTHLHMDHTAGIVDLPKDIPYVAGENEPYSGFRLIMHSGHLAGMEALYEIDFDEGIDLPPLGRAVDLFGDGSLWAISSKGHSPGHVIFFVNGIDEQVLYTGDACNDQYQFETGIGPGTYSSDLEGGQEVLDRIILFKERYPQVRLVYGHDLKTN
jgi:N-acyl homoserine lactone hydrolase